MRPFCLAAALICLAATGCSNAPLDVAPSVDPSRFQGQWFEIAKLPRAPQLSCTGTTAFYVLRDNGLDVTNQCHIGTLDGPLRTSLQRVDAPGDGTFSKLNLEVGGFVGNYWILEVGDQYEYAAIGVPSRDYLWILGRTPSLDPATLGGIVERLHASGFDTSLLEYTPQWASASEAPSAPVGGALTPPTPPQYGCTLSGAPAASPLWAALGAALALLAAKRRTSRDRRRQS
jgi:apolipoprotein D and lipocalin family protein